MLKQEIDVLKHRRADHSIDSIFIKRWSPRAMSGEKIQKEQLLSLFEAARWAPSSYNNQPWRFIYGMRETPAFERLFALLVDANKVWAKNAAVLLVVVSRGDFEKTGKPSRTHSFDAGAAWENLALEASLSGLVAHGMEGFDYARAKGELGIPEGWTVEAMVAIGRPGDPEDLSEKLRAMESPSPRKSVDQFAFEGRFRA
jgi:nitroreductase